MRRDLTFYIWHGDARCDHETRDVEEAVRLALELPDAYIIVRANDQQEDHDSE